MIIKAAREVTDRGVRPTRVACAHARNEDLTEFELFFGCPVEFGAPSGQLTFSNETLALPLVTDDPHLLEMLRPFCEEAERARNTAAGSLRASVENEVERLLPHGQAAGYPKKGRPSPWSSINCDAASRSSISKNRGLHWRKSRGCWATSGRLRSTIPASAGRPPSAVRNENMHRTEA